MDLGAFAKETATGLRPPHLRHSAHALALDTRSAGRERSCRSPAPSSQLFGLTLCTHGHPWARLPLCGHWGHCGGRSGVNALPGLVTQAHHFLGQELGWGCLMSKVREMALACCKN